MSGWFPVPVEGWPAVAALLTSTGHPWPDTATIADLRWHVDQTGSLPGRVVLARRWNWSPWQVRALLQATDRWWDPLRGPAPESRADLTRRHPARQVPAKSEAGAAKSASAEPEQSHDFRQVEDRIPPSRPTGAVDPPSQNEIVIADPILIDPPVVCGAAASPTAQPIPLTGSDSDRRVLDGARELYGWWRAYHQRAPERPTDDHLALLRARLQATIRQVRDPDRALADCRAVIDWIHTAEEAKHWRGQNNRGPSGSGKRFDGIASIFKRDKWGDRLDAAREWRAAGSPVDEDLGRTDYGPEGEKAWTYLQRLIAEGAGHPFGSPQRVDPRLEPVKLEAMRAALDRVGWSALRRATPDEERGLRRAFLDSYQTARESAAGVPRPDRRRSEAAIYALAEHPTRPDVVYPEIAAALRREVGGG